MISTQKRKSSSVSQILPKKTSRASLTTPATEATTPSIPSTASPAKQSSTTILTKTDVFSEVPSTTTANIAESSGPYSNTTQKENKTAVAVSETIGEHPEDETLKPLLIGLGVGILAGLIIIGVVAWVCVRRRRFYTSRYEDELKPITRSASTGSLNNGHYYQDEYHDGEELESES